MKPDWAFVGAVWGFLGVLLGAFGAHALELSVEAEGWWQTATLYHLIHAVALFAGGSADHLHAPGARGARSLGLLFVGSFIFSATLYAMALGAPRVLGAVTPLGGLLMLAGWSGLALARLRRTQS